MKMKQTFFPDRVLTILLKLSLMEKKNNNNEKQKLNKVFYTLWK